MRTPLNFSSHLTRTHDQIVRYIIPAGLIILLTGMFWLPERPDYHRAFYITLALPTLLALLSNLRLIPALSLNGIYLAFLAFSGYCMLSLSWSGTENATSSLLKRPLYITMLFFSVALITIRNEKTTHRILLTSIAIASLSALISIGYFIFFDNTNRLPGYRALYNPLLTAHVYGAFAAMTLALLFILEKKHFSIALLALTCLLSLLLLTGSRTPLLALAITTFWLVILQRNRVAYRIMIGAITLGGLLVATYPESVTNRGFSYRPEIWQQAWVQIKEQPWIGHGYDHLMVFWVGEKAFADPHNMELAVLFSGGIVGLGLWVALYASALIFSWNNRHNQLVIMGSAALVFGFAAGLTEGNSFMPRPKEHWFLIWIPFSILAAAWAKKRANPYV